jgi:drug/metabolite transporter (DMT)-like permease
MSARHWLIFTTLTLIWGSSFLWIKLAVREVGPFMVVSLRVVFALLVLLPFLLRQRIRPPRDARRWGVLLAQGLMAATVPWLFITWAEQHIDSALATVLNGTVPLFTIVAANALLSDERMTRSRVTGLLVGFVGVVVLVQDDLRTALRGAGEHMVLLGEGAMLVSSCLYGISNTFARLKLRGTPPAYQAFYSLFAAAFLVWGVTPMVESPLRLPASGLTWVAVAWLGMLGAGVSYLLFYILLHAVGATRTATVTYTIPLVGVTLGVVVLGEPLKWSLVAGMVLIVSGVWRVNRR